MSTLEDAQTDTADDGNWIVMRASGSRPAAVVAVFVLALVTLPAVALVLTFAALS